jgi:hypothetical protein
MYTTAQQLIDFTNHSCLKELQIDGNNTKLEELLQLAKKRIDIYCGQSFDFEEGTKKLNGNSSSVIDLPKRLTSLTSVTISGASINIDLFDIADAGYSLVIADGSFESGYANIVIGGIWGYDTENEVIPDPLPFDLTFASNKLAEDYGLKRYGVDQEDQIQAVGPFYQQSMGSWNYKQKSALDIDSRSTGNDDIDMLLSPLVIENISKNTDRSAWYVEVI